MLALIKREINSFFASPIGYLVIAVFIVINGLFLWVFGGNYNILDAGFADLSAFFELAPWVLLFLIPAVTMRAFSDELKMGTLELLLTKPISLRNVVLGKYFGAVILILIALLPSIIYIFSISALGNPPGNWDVGSTLGSYIGLLFLVLAYTAIGVFASTLSSNQIVAFIISVFICFLFYYGFEGITTIIPDFPISVLGMKAHFDSVARGVLDTRDIIYFTSLAVAFICFTVLKLNKHLGKNNLKYIVYIIIGLFLVNLASNYFYNRFDLTEDHRYTLSRAAKNTIAPVDSPIVIEVFLEGNFPPEFRRLQEETKQLLEEFSSYNNNIKYEFIDPLKDEEQPEAIQKQFQQMGLTPAQIQVNENGKVSTELVYPWALAYYNGKTVKIPLLKNQLGITSEERVNNSIQNLEYAFADGFNKLVVPKKRKVAVLKGNGELDDKYIADFFSTLRDYYYIAPFTLDSASIAPKKTLEQLQNYDLIVAAKPTEAFNDTEKYILDQYIMNGGASLWLIDATVTKQDSLSGKTYAVGEDLRVNDLFFKYGLRINPELVSDLYSAPIVLASGEQQDAQYNKYPWFFYPLSASANNHPIVTNIEAVKFEYASPIDTLPSSAKKTILLSTSPITKIIGTPHEIDIEAEIPRNLKIINEGPNPGEYNAGEVPLAVLLEGKFTSAFNNRIKPFKFSADKTESSTAKMVVISDGDIIKNQFQGNRPLELGFDKWTNSLYGNKEFLLNTVNYLLDDSGLINIRSKKITVPFLDQQKTMEQRTFWQIVNILLPLGLLAIFGIGFYYYRKRKYTH